MLEGATAVNLVAVVGELIRDGHCNFKLETSALCIPTVGGIDALKTLQRMVQNAGGHLAWDGLTVNHPYPTEGDAPGRRASSTWRLEMASFEDHRHPVQPAKPDITN